MFELIYFQPVKVFGQSFLVWETSTTRYVLYFMWVNDILKDEVKIKLMQVRDCPLDCFRCDREFGHGFFVVASYLLSSWPIARSHFACLISIIRPRISGT